MRMKKGSRGIRIQTRILLSGLIILLELYFIVLSVFTFTEGAIWVYTAAEIISVITVIHIITERGNQSYKIMWIVFIMAVPVFGVLAYLLWGGGRMFPHLKKRMIQANKKYFSLLSKDDAQRAVEYNDMLHYRQAAYLKSEAGLPIYSNTSSEFLETGERFYSTLLNELKKAQKYIFLEFFILAQGEMFDGIFKILKEKSEQGVEIKIIFDDFGSIKRQDKDFIKKLKKAGISVSVFNPIRPSIDIFMNNRNHRKIVIIDGEIAFTGGINVGDEYINRLERFGHWLDSGIMLKGEATNSFLAMFCSMWEFITQESIDMKSYMCEHNNLNDGFYIPYCDDPLGDTNVAQEIYMQIIGTAQKYVYITTPYLILDSSMTSCLCLAAKSGVDVRIITPHHPDKWYVHPVTQYYYSELLDAGVKIYEYTPGFIHSKLFVSDNSIATVGTVNMDYRSFNFHFECGVWISSANSVKTIKESFLETVKHSKQIEIEEWKKRNILKKLKQTILHLFAPLM